MPLPADLTEKDGLRIYTVAAALVRVPDAFFSRYPIEAQVTLAATKDPSEVLSRLLEGGHSVVAGRLAGAFRRVGRTDAADEIVKSMKAAGYNVREVDPFKPAQAFGVFDPGTPPVVGRVRALWEATRNAVVPSFPKAPGLP